METLTPPTTVTLPATDALGLVGLALRELDLVPRGNELVVDWNGYPGQHVADIEPQPHYIAGAYVTLLLTGSLWS